MAALRPHVEPAEDLGLFGPDSVAWRVHADPAILIGGIRALLIQALHPLTMAGVADHSTIWVDPWSRLRQTHEYLVTTVFGTTAEAEAAGAAVRAVHATVNGVDPVTGQPYDATDPELLRWVHDVEVDSFLASHRRFGAAPLKGEDPDRYVAEMARAGELVGLGAQDIPQNVADLVVDLDRYRPQLRTSAATRDGARLVVWPPMPLAARPLWGAMVAGAIAIMPADLRRLQWLPPSFGPLDAGLSLPASLLARAARLVLPRSPQIRAARARAAAAAGTA